MKSEIVELKSIMETIKNRIGSAASPFSSVVQQHVLIFLNVYMVFYITSVFLKNLIQGNNSTNLQRWKYKMLMRAFIVEVCPPMENYLTKLWY